MKQKVRILHFLTCTIDWNVFRRFFKIPTAQVESTVILFKCQLSQIKFQNSTKSVYFKGNSMTVNVSTQYELYFKMMFKLAIPHVGHVYIKFITVVVKKTASCKILGWTTPYYFIQCFFVWNLRICSGWATQFYEQQQIQRRQPWDHMKTSNIVCVWRISNTSLGQSTCSITLLWLPIQYSIYTLPLVQMTAFLFMFWLSCMCTLILITLCIR